MSKAEMLYRKGLIDNDEYERLNVIDLDLALETKLEREFNYFKKGLKKLPKSKIIEKAYEITSKEEIDKINKLLEKGCSIAKIAKIVRVSRGTLYRFLFRTKNELFIKRQNEIYGQTNENSIYGYTRICGGTIEKIG